MTKRDIGLIYEQVLAHCPPYVHPAPWQDVSVPDNIRRLPPDPTAVRDALCAQYPSPQLLESGAVVEAAGSGLQLAPALCVGDGPLIALRKGAKSLPFDITTPCGSLAGARLPVCAAFADECFGSLYARAGRLLCVTCSTAEVALLLSLGVPATLASGLAGSHGRDLQDVCKWYDFARPLPDGSDGRARIPGLRLPQAVFLGGSLVELSPEEPPGLAEIVAHCGGVERHLQICLERFFLWRPSLQEIERIRFCHRTGSVGDVGAAVLDCLKACRQKLVSPGAMHDEPQDLPAAIQRLVAADGKGARRGKAWNGLQRLIDAQCIGPWLEQLEQTEDPAERNLLLSVATASGIVHAQSVRLFLAMRNGCPTSAAGSPSLVSPEEFNQYLQSTNLMLRSIQALWKCRG